MKSLTSLLLGGLALAAFMAVPSVRAQTADENHDEFSTFIHPKATPGAQGGTTASTEKKPLTAMLAKDPKGKQPTSAFSTADSKIYLVWTDGTATKGAKLRFVWSSEGAKGKKIYESAVTLPGPGALGSSFLNVPAGGLAPGKYQVAVYEGDALSKKVPFSVQK